MKCDEAKEQLVLLAYEELSEEERANLELHMHGCPECEAEMGALQVFGGQMQQETVPAVSPNLLAAARMRLDDALDQAGEGTLLMQLRMGLLRTWHHLYAAPALATLLIGAGFLSGSLLTRYQAAHAPRPEPVTISSNDLGSAIGNISSITPTSDPEVVQVTYNRIVPTTFTGRIDEPQARQLLLLGAQKSTDNGVRADSVSYLAKECSAGHLCEHSTGAEGTGFRDALLVSLRYDKSPAVRLKALEGLKRFIGEDQKVRDAVLESLMVDRNAEVRIHAIGMLEPVQADSSVRQVLHTVSTKDENPFIRNASMQALGSGDGIQ
ncbi:MAG: HEAT repeat domain-containing protein [Janthinobacterium lividum]